MLVRLLRETRIKHHAGETVNVSPEEGAFLLSVGSAALVKEQTEKAVKEPAAETAVKEPAKRTRRNKNVGGYYGTDR